jgi:hypothetical protein
MSYSKKDFAEQELNILRKSVDNIQQNIGKKILNDPNVKQIIEIVEDFLRKKKLICYGGTAINNILPEQDQFYNKDVELPDYDFFSPHALEDAKELAEIYYKAGFEEVEAKAGVHAGTFKVFVNFIPVADVTQLVKEIYGNLKRETIKIDGILYCPPNYLRMSMYLELSRPKGDVSRWEKVLKRLTLLNKHYPLRTSNCKNIEIQRLFSSYDKVNSNDLFYITRDILINNGVIFFGALAHKLYTKYNKNNSIATIPDFDVLSTNPKRTAEILKERLIDYNFKNVRIVKKPGIGEIIAPHYEVKVGKNAIAFIYKPIACHSYNTHQLKEKTVKIASIDTMLSFYLAFLYSNRPYYEDDRILCMAQYLFNVQQKNRLKQQGLLKRFGIECYGEQETIEKMRAEKTNKFKELKNDRNSKEYQKYFLKYIPGEKKSTKKITTKKTTNKKTTNKKTTNKKTTNKKTTNKKTKSKSSNKKTNKNKVPFTD